MLVARLVQFIFIEGCWFNEYSFIRSEMGEVFFYCFRNLLNDIWRIVRFDMYVLDYNIWFLVGSVGAVVEITSDVQIFWFIIFMLQSIITSRPSFLNNFCRRFLIFSICGLLQFLKIDSPSSLCKLLLFVLYCRPKQIQ